MSKRINSRSTVYSFYLLLSLFFSSPVSCFISVFPAFSLPTISVVFMSDPFFSFSSSCSCGLTSSRRIRAFLFIFYFAFNYSLYMVVGWCDDEEANPHKFCCFFFFFAPFVPVLRTIFAHRRYSLDCFKVFIFGDLLKRTFVLSSQLGADSL